MRKVKIVDRNFFGGYYRTLASGPDNLLMGCLIEHAYPCGTFTLDGVDYNLMFMRFSKDLLADTAGQHQESFDLSLDDADVIASQELLQAAATDTDVDESLISQFLPCVQPLILQDLQDGLSLWDIVNSRIGVLVWHFMGFTFDDVVDVFPEIISPTITTDEDGNEAESPNIWRNSQETA